MKYFKLTDGDWFECEKSDLRTGDRFKRTEETGHTLESIFSDKAIDSSSISRREFWQRVGDSVYAQLLTLAETDNLLKARIDIINADQNVWLLSPEYTSWFSDLVSNEVITQEEYDFIFNIGAI